MADVRVSSRDSVHSDWVWDRGGARVNWTWFTWPFAILSFSEEGMELKILFMRWFIPRSDVLALTRTREGFSLGIRIRHERPDIPEILCFLPRSFSSLTAALELKGYEVVDQDDFKEA